MKSLHNIEKTLSEFKINPRSEMRQRVLGDALAKQEQRERPGVSDENKWSWMMNHLGVKLSIAAIVLLFIVMGLNSFTDTQVTIANVAWGDVIEQLNQHERYVCTQRIVREEGPTVPEMRIYHASLSLRRQETVDGDIHVIDMRGKDAVTIEIHPATKKAQRTILKNFGPRKDPDIIEKVKKIAQDAVEPIGTRDVDGEVQFGFKSQPNEHNAFTVWVDPETKLPAEVQIEHINRGQTIILTDFGYDFELTEEAFSTEVPDGYTVETIETDYGPVEPKTVNYQAIKEDIHHSAYQLDSLDWAKEVGVWGITDPLGTKAMVYVTVLECEDGNTLLLVQGVYFDMKRMVWIPQQKLLGEYEGGIESYAHPNGAIFAEYFLKAIAEVDQSLFDVSDLSESRFTQMLVMDEVAAVAIVGNKSISDEEMADLVSHLKNVE